MGGCWVLVFSIEEGREGTSKKSLIKNWPLMSSMTLYCVFSLHDMAYTEVYIFLRDIIFLINRLKRAFDFIMEIS